MAVEQSYPREYKTEIVDYLPFHVAFIDVDSSASEIEAINWMAAIRGKLGAIEELTNQAMNGLLSFGDVFPRRLREIRPREEDLAVVAREYIQFVTPYARQSIRVLTRSGVDVYLVSGGYDAVIYPLANYFGLPKDHVLANTLYFKNGKYSGYDKTNPLSREKGKTAVIRSLNLQGRKAIIGDSITEQEASEAGEVDMSIGYGGLVARPVVQQKADVFLPNRSFAALVPLLLGRVGVINLLRQYPHDRGLVMQGLSELQGSHFNGRTNKLMYEVQKFIYEEQNGLLA